MPKWLITSIFAVAALTCAATIAEENSPLSCNAS